MGTLVKVHTSAWVNAEGRRVRSADPSRVKKVHYKSRFWYASGVPGWPAGKRMSLGVTDKIVARKLLNELVEAAERGQVGLIPLTQGRRPIEEHISDYRAALDAKGNTDIHTLRTCNMVTAICKGCKFTVAGTINAAAVSAWLRDQRRRKDNPIGVDTANHYITAFKAFAAWLVKERRLYVDPVKYMTKGNAATDRRRIRRALTIEEMEAIVAAARESEIDHFGTNGRARALIYLTACMTGFRAHEVATLTPQVFDLAAPQPTVTVTAVHAKNRRRTVQPIPRPLAEELAQFIADRRINPAFRIWPGNWWTKAAKMLRIELAAVGIPYCIESADGPLFADFHCLRHSFITWVVSRGANVKQTQALARHATPHMTFQRYAHVDMLELGGVVGRIRPVESVPQLTAVDELTLLRMENERLRNQLASASENGANLGTPKS